MPRGKRCPKCGSKKLKRDGEWRCRTCGHVWSGKTKKTRSKKNKVRF